MKFTTKRVWKVRIDGAVSYENGSPGWKDAENAEDYFFDDGATTEGVLRDIRESFHMSFSKMPGSITYRQVETGWIVVHQHIGQIAFVSTLDYPVAPLRHPTHF